MIYFLIAIVWLLCGLYTTGVTVAYFQNEFAIIAKENYKEDLAYGVVFGLFGPFTSIMVTFLSGFLKHGWQLTPYKGPRA